MAFLDTPCEYLVSLPSGSSPPQLEPWLYPVFSCTQPLFRCSQIHMLLSTGIQQVDYDHRQKSSPKVQNSPKEDTSGPPIDHGPTWSKKKEKLKQRGNFSIGSQQ